MFLMSKNMWFWLLSQIHMEPVYRESRQLRGQGGGDKSLTTAAQQKPEPEASNKTPNLCPAFIYFLM